jgi:hypothetical protein
MPGGEYLSARRRSNLPDAPHLARLDRIACRFGQPHEALRRARHRRRAAGSRSGGPLNTQSFDGAGDDRQSRPGTAADFTFLAGSRRHTPGRGTFLYREARAPADGSGEFDAVRLYSPAAKSQAVFVYASDGLDWFTVRLKGLDAEARYLISSVWGEELAEATGAEPRAESVDIVNSSDSGARVILVTPRRRRGGRSGAGAEQARRQHDHGSQQTEDAVHGDADEPERQHQQPDERIEDDRGECQRPAEHEQQQPQQQLQHVHLRRAP